MRSLLFCLSQLHGLLVRRVHGLVLQGTGGQDEKVRKRLGCLEGGLHYLRRKCRRWCRYRCPAMTMSVTASSTMSLATSGVSASTIASSVLSTSSLSSSAPSWSRPVAPVRRVQPRPYHHHHQHGAFFCDYVVAFGQT
ncbi:hypothetical protein CPC08DRAFT_401753 [Agrocybe pediades]|nr:hypothetical protein CPC08DRAFT_401753 [Agrocybe pediades]